MKPRRMDWLCGNDYMLMAALLLADGEYVLSTELAAGLFDRSVSGQVSRVTIRRHALNLLRARVPISERYLANGRVLWYRLAALPADEHLEPMLACVPAVKRSAWWSRRVSQTHTRAS